MRSRLLGWLAPVFSKTYTASVCGHKTKIRGFVRAFGERITTAMPLGEGGRPEYCLACVGKMAIRCGCGRAIFIGDPVALLVPDDARRPYALLEDGGGRKVWISCMRCLHTAAGRSGFWMPPGKVERTPSLFELALEGGAAVFNDAADPKDPGTVVRIP